MMVKAIVRERIASGNTEGISASEQAEYEIERVDSREYDELERLREKMRQDGRRSG